MLQYPFLALFILIERKGVRPVDRVQMVVPVPIHDLRERMHLAEQPRIRVICQPIRWLASNGLEEICGYISKKPWKMGNVEKMGRIIFPLRVDEAHCRITNIGTV